MMSCMAGMATSASRSQAASFLTTSSGQADSSVNTSTMLWRSQGTPTLSNLGTRTLSKSPVPWSGGLLGVVRCAPLTHGTFVLVCNHSREFQTSARGAATT